MAKNKKKIPAGMPSYIAEKQGLSTNDITEGKDTGSWFMNDEGEVDNSRTAKEMVKDFNEAKGYDQPKPLEGARGNLGDNDLAYNNYEEKFLSDNGGDQLIAALGGNQGEVKSVAPKPENTAEVTKRHNEELAKLQNEIGDTNVATGTILNKPLVTEEVTSTETGDDNDNDDDNSNDKNELEKAPEEANLDYSDYISNFYGPKNGADYVKALWDKGEIGKAVGNVLGNLLGSLGSINVSGASGSGRDFHSDWEDYRTNYTKAMAERNQQAFDQNMSIANQLRTNDVARNELLKTLENYQKIGGKLTSEKFENIRKALTATGKGSQIDYYLASVLGEISSDPDLKKAAKATGENAVKLLGNIAQFTGNTLMPINYLFGGGWK